MNNPLTVLSGNAQLLASRLLDDENRGRAKTMVDAAQRLSDLITALHLFADPPKPKPARVNLSDVLKRCVADARARAKVDGRAAVAQVRLRVSDAVMDAYLDRLQVGGAVTEVIVNALEARPKSPVVVRADTARGDGRLLIEVTDDGTGMSERVLTHAADPFFSEKPAGRQTGLGLARAKRLAELNNGSLSIESTLGHGSAVTIAYSSWRRDGAVSGGVSGGNKDGGTGRAEASEDAEAGEPPQKAA
jgi:two-component system sensor histidine kinase AtoS